MNVCMAMLIAVHKVTHTHMYTSMHIGMDADLCRHGHAHEHANRQVLRHVHKPSAYAYAYAWKCGTHELALHPHAQIVECRTLPPPAERRSSF